MGSVADFSWITRGYTGHEHLAEFGLINMNGRLYDPVLGRMLSPDNYVQDATSTQGFNRYSYVVNNPLKYIDPSGENWEDFAREVINTIGFLSGGTLFSESVTYLNDKINGIQRDSYFDMDYLLGRAAPSPMNSGSGTQSIGDYSGSLNDKSNSWAEQEEYAIESYIWGYWWSQARVDGKDFGEPKRNEPIYKTRLVKIENNNPTREKGGRDSFLGEKVKNNIQNYTRIQGPHTIQIVDMTAGWITPLFNLNFQGGNDRNDTKVMLNGTAGNFTLTAYGRYEPQGERMFNGNPNAPTPIPGAVYFRYRETNGSGFRFVYGYFPFPDNVTNITQNGPTIIR